MKSPATVFGLERWHPTYLNAYHDVSLPVFFLECSQPILYFSTQGHYISDVYDMKKQSWLTYNDLDVSRTQEAAVQRDRDRSGYIFFYMHKWVRRVTKYCLQLVFVIIVKQLDPD